MSRSAWEAAAELYQLKHPSAFLTPEVARVFYEAGRKDAASIVRARVDGCALDAAHMIVYMTDAAREIEEVPS